MAEITNTPWGERYAKCFEWETSPDSERSDHEFHKEFHVSPFIGMNIDYDWRFRAPGDRFQADMILQEERKLFLPHTSSSIVVL